MSPWPTGWRCAEGVPEDHAGYGAFVRDPDGQQRQGAVPPLRKVLAGYIEIRKGFVGKRPRTSARLTSVGRAAFDQHVAALQEIVAKAGTSVLPST